MSVHVGTVIYNYRFTQTLGEGGFGVVYLAVHEQLGRKATAKVLHPEYARRPQVVDRFFREARAVCEIGHPAIIDITNYGHLPSGEPFYLMEYVEGKALSDLAKERHGLTPEEVAIIFGPVADALAAAHAARIIHRDLKPDNVMVVERGGQIVDVKLLDFGIAKLLGDAGDHVQSQTGAAMGTPNYMAPEQAMDAKNVDQRADVYGLGATIFAALTGSPPFAGGSTTEILVALATQPAPRLRQLRPELPYHLDEVIARCLEKNPAARPSTITEAWHLISQALGYPMAAASSHRMRLPSSPAFYAVTPVPTGPGPVPTTLGASASEVSMSRPASMPHPMTAPLPPPRGKKRGVIAAVLVALAAAATAGVLIVTQSGSGDSEKPGGAAGKLVPPDATAGKLVPPDAAAIAAVTPDAGARLQPPGDQSKRPGAIEDGSKDGIGTKKPDPDNKGTKKPESNDENKNNQPKLDCSADQFASAARSSSKYRVKKALGVLAKCKSELSSSDYKSHSTRLRATLARLSKPKSRCSDGKVMINGYCRCPAGTSWNGLRCVRL